MSHGFLLLRRILLRLRYTISRGSTRAVTSHDDPVPPSAGRAPRERRVVDCDAEMRPYGTTHLRYRKNGLDCLRIQKSMACGCHRARSGRTRLGVFENVLVGVLFFNSKFRESFQKWRKSILQTVIFFLGLGEVFLQKKNKKLNPDSRFVVSSQNPMFFVISSMQNVIFDFVPWGGVHQKFQDKTSLPCKLLWLFSVAAPLRGDDAASIRPLGRARQ